MYFMLKDVSVMPFRDSVLFPNNIIPLEVGREKSVKLIDDILSSSLFNANTPSLVLLTQKDGNQDDPEIKDLYQIGTSAKILKVIKNSGYYTVIVQGLDRVKLKNLTSSDPYFRGNFEKITDVLENDDEERFLTEHLTNLAIEVIKSSPSAPKETNEILKDLTTPMEICDFVSANLGLNTDALQNILECESLKDRIKLIVASLQSKIKEAEYANQIKKTIIEESDKTQREYFLKNQLKAIRKELGEEDDIGDIEEKVNSKPMSEEAKAAAKKQLNRLKTMQASSSEYSVTLNYLETLLDVPWLTRSDDNLDLENARQVFDAEHFGLEAVKKRLVEYLAVKSLRDDMKSPIICLAGPPGVGKTSISKSIARALGRKFVRISLGGVHDESEIRGHRRTYVGAMAGRVAKAMIKAGTNNPVILLDEIDKMGRDRKGDPESAMLEVLDPEQNHTFSDHFIEVPIDLSKVLFIATANTLSNISAPLRDRMEIIEVPSYTSFEKSQIAKNHLIPKQIREHGITADNIEIKDESLDYIIDHYTRESGVRTLERQIASVCRHVAVKVANEPETDRKNIKVEADVNYVKEALGPERFFSEVAQRVSVAGVSTGLAWTQSGGDILFVEATKMLGDGKVKLTGQLGDVMKESADAAFSFLRSNALEFGLSPDFYKTIDLHIHFPAGAVPKDGPSAGITIFSSILSILTGIKIKNDVAMTGEITLRGQVLPVGGIKEKLTAAHRAGIKRVVIPKRCEKDLVDLNEEVREALDIIPVETVSELPALLLEKPLPSVPVVDETHIEATPMDDNPMN